jgi:hypothetical protein
MTGKCELCGNHADKLYRVYFSEPDGEGGSMNVPYAICADCVPEEMVDHVLDQRKENEDGEETYD